MVSWGVAGVIGGRRGHGGCLAALRSVVDITSWAIVTFHGSHRVDAFAFVVTAAVVFQALVHVYVHRFVWVLMCE